MEIQEKNKLLRDGGEKFILSTQDKNEKLINIEFQKINLNCEKDSEDVNFMNIETLIIDIIFRRKFGKNLCFINGTKNDKSSLEMKIEIYELIRKVKIGDKVEVKGYFFLDFIKNKFVFQVLDLIILEKCPKDFNIFDKRLETTSLKKENEKTLCKYFRKNRECKNENCIFRHYLLEDEEERLEKLKSIQEKMFKDHHEGDYIDEKEKKTKSSRHKDFADFLVKTYSIEYLKSGPILDVAGGKGLVSFYLKTEYNLESIIIDLRGASLPKTFSKFLSKRNIEIEERRIMFDDNFDKELIKRSSLIIGLHPDQATDCIIDIAIKNDKKFAIVPCCVFPIIFSNRFLENGEFVNDYPKYIKYIQEKVPLHKIGFLEIIGRNKIIYID